MKKLVYILISFFFFISCDYFQLKNKNNSDEIVAEVGVKELYKSDLNHLYDLDMDVLDSTTITNEYIENWAKKQIILTKANYNISDEDKEDLDKMVNAYKDELYINTYKEAWLEQNRDTLIDDLQIKEFYTTNNSIFKSNEDMLQLKYISFRINNKDKENIRHYFLMDNEENREELMKNEQDYTYLLLDDNTWLNYRDLLKMIPILKPLKKESIFMRSKFIELDDETDTHLILIEDVARRNEIAPLSQVTPVIKEMILHKNRLKYFSELENKLLEDAIKNNKYKKH